MNKMGFVQMNTTSVFPLVEIVKALAKESLFSHVLFKGNVIKKRIFVKKFHC